MTVPAFFRRGEDGRFDGTDAARGPWSVDHCHAGPVTGLIARAAEAAAGPNKMLTRLTVDLVRPVPLTGITLKAETGRRGRTLATVSVDVLSQDGAVCAQARTMHVRTADIGPVPTPRIGPPVREGAAPGVFPIRAARHTAPFFSDAVEILYPPGTDQGPGPKTIWMKTPALVDGEISSPIQRLCPLADCGNGISWNAPPTDLGFLNADLSVHVHRAPVSDWLASQAVSHWQPNGVGVSQAVLFDTEGPVATALQTLVLSRM